MKRLVGILLMVAMLLTSAMSEEMWALCKTYVNVRERASTKGIVIGKLYCGDSVETDGAAKNGWAYCTDLSFEMSHGWVHSGYLVKDKPEPINMELEVISNGRVAIRKSVNGERTGWAKKGDRIMVYWQSSDWSLTSKGYIQTKFLRRLE